VIIRGAPSDDSRGSSTRLVAQLHPPTTWAKPPNAACLTQPKSRPETNLARSISTCHIGLFYFACSERITAVAVGVSVMSHEVVAEDRTDKFENGMGDPTIFFFLREKLSGRAPWSACHLSSK
jgi:hypothetical protein